MIIRKYKKSDCIQITELFFETVHSVNSKDYTKAQLDVWANGKIDIAIWNQSFLEHHTLVAEENNKIIGFGDMDNTGYLDRLYVHKDYLRKGIATAIMVELERQANKQGILILTTHASITAKPFFEKQCYHVIRENIVVRGDEKLRNYIMEKHLQ